MGSVSRVIHFLLGRCSYYYTSLAAFNYASYPLPPTGKSWVAYLDLHPLGWPFHRSHLSSQRVNSILVTEVFSEHILSRCALQPHPRHLISGRVVSAPEPCLSTGTFKCQSTCAVSGISSDVFVRQPPFDSLPPIFLVDTDYKVML